jgi:hypothetical protein
MLIYGFCVAFLIGAIVGIACRMLSLLLKLNDSPFYGYKRPRGKLKHGVVAWVYTSLGVFENVHLEHKSWSLSYVYVQFRAMKVRRDTKITKVEIYRDGELAFSFLDKPVYLRRGDDFWPMSICYENTYKKPSYRIG